MPFKDSISRGTVDDIRARQLISVEQIQNALDLMHKDVKGLVTKRRQQPSKAHNKKTNIQPVDFSNGDFVLVRTAGKRGHKLGFTWRGPRRVVNTINPLVYEVEHFKTEARETVHATRLLLYRADMEGTEVDPKLVAHAEHTDAVYQDVEKLCDIRKEGSEFQVLMQWTGLPDEQDYTWEPPNQVLQDVKEMLKDFLEAPGKRSLKTQALSILKL